MTFFLRLLKTDIPAKGEALAAQIAAVNTGQSTPETFTVAPADFGQIPGSPFAYWAEHLLSTFKAFQTLEPNFGFVIRGPEPHDLDQSLRLWVEVQPGLIGPKEKWVNYAKGGQFKTYAPDVHLLVDYAPARDGSAPFRRPGDETYYFKPGATYTQRTTSRLTLRVMNAECLTSPKGPGIVPSQNDWLWYLMALGNSIIFQHIIELKVGAADVAARSYDLHIIRSIPVPLPNPETKSKLEELVKSALVVAAWPDLANELAHTFSLPTLALLRNLTIYEATQASQTEYTAAQNRLTKTQNEIDSIITDLYGLSATDMELQDTNVTQFAEIEPLDAGLTDESGDDTEENEATTGDAITDVQNLIMWCLGCAFGRWDARFAIDPSLLPKLQGPFDSLPRCSPGMLVGPDGLPATPGNIVSEAWLRARPNVITLTQTPDPQPLTPDSAYPLRIDWDGIIPDDEDHPDDIVRRVRDVLDMLWGERAEAIEREACQVLNVASLRDYFRQPKAFFDFHIKRYSKSRRKAPIYWLLQSAKKSYGLWLYYHRLDPDTLFKALTLYADPRLNRERSRLGDLRLTLKPEAPARDRRAVEKAIARQESLLNELTDFRNELERIARLGLPPDFNDGVTISIAPLHSLVPWKEAAKMWSELTTGKYGWSTMSQRMQQRRLTKGAGD